MDLGRETLETGALKMASSHSEISLSAIRNASKERFSEFIATAAMVGVG